MVIKLLVFSVLVCDVLGQYLSTDIGFAYELPDDDENKSLNITINQLSYQFQITTKCYNYDALKHFEVRLGDSNNFELRNGVELDFIKCFNNASDSENYKYQLSRWFNSLPYFKTEYHEGYPFTARLDEYAVVNTDVLFKNFDFDKFDAVSLINLGFASTKFLKQLSCQTCIFENNSRIDFNDFGDHIAETSSLQIKFNKLINFNSDNLKKLPKLISIDIKDFDLDDINTFNVPDLFLQNVNITDISLARSKEKIILHENVFRGLNQLYRIMLEALKLDNIPNDLFMDLNSLQSVYLSSNTIKTVDPTIFQANMNLGFVGFQGNPFFTEPHDKLESFHVGNESIRFELGNFTAHTFDLLEQLVKNSKVAGIVFQSFLIDKFNVEDFTKILVERNSTIDILFQSGEPALDLEHIKTIAKLESEYDLTDKSLNAIIRIKFAGDAVCHDCSMKKQMFEKYLKRYQNPGFYIETSNLFLQFTIPESCNHLEEQFEETFNENCPASCTCKFNSFLDKVKINCNNQNLTEILHIPYPTQFEKLHSIDLNYENNSISSLSLENQDAKVVEKLSTLNFKNNKIKTIQINETDLEKNIWALNLCGNPYIGIHSGPSGVQLILASGYHYFYDSYCNTYNEYPVIGDYITEHKSSELETYLNDTQCN